MKKKEGLTLIELVCTIAVLSILAISAYPSMQNLLHDMQAQTEKNHWVRLFNFARSSSILENTIVVICPVENNRCVSDMHKPWSVFKDSNKSKTIEENEEVLRVFEPNIDAKYGYYSAGLPYFRFGSHTDNVYLGMPEGFTICTHGQLDNTAYHLTVNIIGRVKVFNKRNTEGQPLRKYKGSWIEAKCDR